MERARLSDAALRRARPLRDPSTVLTPSGNVAKTRAAQNVNKDGTPDARAANGGHANSKKRKSPWLQRAEDERAQKTAALDAVAAALANPDKLEALQRRLRDSVLRDDFSEFCRAAWHVVEPATDLEWNWHHQLICGVLQSLFETWHRGCTVQGYEPPVVNTAINVSPGSLKSRLVTVMFPAWCWLRAPGMKFICLSVNQDVSFRDARVARHLIASDWYRELNSDDKGAERWTLKDDQDAIGNYGNTAGGERLSKPSGSAIVGLRADCVLYDDPNSPDESIDERVKVNKVWDDSIYTRVNSKKSLRIGIQQRVGEDDWTDHVVKRQGEWSPDNPLGWMKVVLPAEFDTERRFRLPECLVRVLRELKLKWVVTEDPRKEQGEPVHPSRQSKKDLEGERKRWAGTGHFAAQFLQLPSEQEGTVVKREWFRFFTLDEGVHPKYDEQRVRRPRPPGMEMEKNGKAYHVGQRKFRPGLWDFDWVVASVDCALKKTVRGSQWGILIVAGQKGRRFILDDCTVGGKEGGADIIEVLGVLGQAVRFWKPDKILVEDKAAGDEMMRRIQEAIASGDRTFAGAIVEPVKVGNLGKDARLDTALPCIANGMVHLLEDAPWHEKFLNEVCTFPRARFDDRVDALTQVINHYIEDEIVEFELPDW